LISIEAGAWALWFGAKKRLNRTFVLLAVVIWSLGDLCDKIVTTPESALLWAKISGIG
jgi:hypothetical protein